MFKRLTAWLRGDSRSQAASQPAEERSSGEEAFGNADALAAESTTLGTPRLKSHKL